MDKPPLLTDRTALTRNRARALQQGAELHLHDLAIDEVKDRLSMVNRTFTSPAIVTGFPDHWAAEFPGAKIVADSDVLELDQGAHDLVIDGLTLHWSNDPVGQIVQARRALKPDGLYLAILFGGETLSQLRDALTRAEAAVSGGLSPRVLPMGEIRELGALLQRSGLNLPVADSFRITATYQSLPHLMADLRAMGEANAMTDRTRRFLPRRMMVEAQQIYHDLYAQPDGRLPATFELVALTGWSPDESQPQPLRPGSAKTSLADALGTTETKLTD